jgi:trk system potassium uptake protein TrkA
MNLSITPETILDEHMTMLVLGEKKSMQKCFNL